MRADERMRRAQSVAVDPAWLEAQLQRRLEVRVNATHMLGVVIPIHIYSARRTRRPETRPYGGHFASSSPCGDGHRMSSTQGRVQADTELISWGLPFPTFIACEMHRSIYRPL
jgi:hypothetical protein